MNPTHPARPPTLTDCIHGGDAANASGHLSPPICRSSAFEFPNSAEGAARAADIRATEFYGRWGDHNAREFEMLLARLENAEDAVCAASGMAIIDMIARGYLNRGDHFLASHQCYAEVKILFEDMAQRFGVGLDFVDSRDARNFLGAIRPNTRLVFTETPANPTLDLVDIALVAEVCARVGALLVVDSTFASPFGQRALDHGASIVVHSATKYLGGHSDVIAGVCAGARSALDPVRKAYSFHGPHLDPAAAWLLCRGIRTLGLRIAQHARNALAIARELESCTQVKRVWYPFLPSHPQHALARRQMDLGGGMVCFELHGGMPAALAWLERLRLVRLAVSLGGVSTTATHPASMTHNLLPPEDLARAGIAEGMIRLSVGIEETADIVADVVGSLSGLREA